MWTCPRHQPGGLYFRLQPRGTKRVLIMYRQIILSVIYVFVRRRIQKRLLGAIGGGVTCLSLDAPGLSRE